MTMLRYLGERLGFLPKALPADPDSLGALLGAALDRANEQAPQAEDQPEPNDLPGRVVGPVTVYHQTSGGCFASDADLLTVCAARELCWELAARGHDPQVLWEMLCALPSASLADVHTIDGWATLSAYLTGGADVVRLARAEEPR